MNYFWDNLLKWYKNNKREFLWRKTNDPFHILIAEILLQQTTAKQVAPVYKKIIKKYKTPDKLEDAKLSEIRNIIRPLGLLYRAENLINAAKIISKKYNGKVPAKKNNLKGIPGVGDYTADAVMCYGFNKKIVPIDTNVLRVFKRYFDLNSDYADPLDDNKLLKKIRNLYKFEAENYKELNLAILDFANIICKKRSPRCENCCINKNCSYNKKANP